MDQVLFLLVQIESFIDAVFSIFLIYTIITQSPPKMKIIQVGLLKAVLADMFLSLFAAWGFAPFDAYFPMFLIRINGCFKYFGKYSDRLTVLVLLLTLVPAIMAAAECCIARFAITYKWERLLKLFNGYPYVSFQLLQFFGGIPFYLAAYITHSGDYQDVVKLAAPHNYTHMIQDITPDDVLVVVNTDICTIPLIMTCLGVPLPVAPICFILVSYLTHKKIISQMGNMSTENYKLQKSITVLLFAQISLPVFLVLLPMSAMIGFLEFNAVNPLQRDDYKLDLIYVTSLFIGLYPICNLFMTLFIIKPYRKFLFRTVKRLFRKKVLPI